MIVQASAVTLRTTTPPLLQMMAASEQDSSPRRCCARSAAWAAARLEPLGCVAALGLWWVEAMGLERRHWNKRTRLGQAAYMKILSSVT
ncbi:hypothetical protein FRZ61_17470 [Hypericibacter adhaerens]|uniref:Uncharacterized protein n=1 Tax=Hypericibacter adhaerens TaxID=2602016 RepID=A0A5J6MVX6_9PROT|nr:hypothetical protein FRZ61_17470 [Hypericibacter adhaerens]